MLTPEYLLRISEGAEEIAAQLHESIINAVVERITIRLGRGDDYILTAKDKWELEVLEEAGYLREDLQAEIAKKTKLQLKEIREAFEDAGITSTEYDDEIYKAAGLSPKPLKQSPHLIRLMQRAYEATQGEWVNYTRTTADAAQQLFIKQCDNAYNLVSTGAVSYTEAVKNAVEAIAEEGVNVTYPSGHVDSIETATLRAVRTGVAQATADITLARMDEYEWDLILVDAHIGARLGDGGENFTNHAWWQGKLYSRSGKDKRYPPFSVCNYGHVQGICGANCRHSFGPGNEGDEWEPIDSKENRKAYELSQRQRALERRIRKTKRELQAAKTSIKNGDDATKAEMQKYYDRKAALLQKQNKAYNDFCEENGLKRLQDRLHVAGWNRSQASTASAAARKKSERKEARASEMFTVIPPPKGDSIQSRSVYNELGKSEIGKTTLDFIKNNSVPVEINYTSEYEPGVRGTTYGNAIYVSAQVTKSIKTTAKTIIHEAAHLQLNTKVNSQHEEAYCFAQEAKHDKAQLTYSDLRNIIKQVKYLYPELKWR